MDRGRHTYDYDEQENVQDRMFNKNISSNWRARYPRRVKDSGLNWKINILVGLNFLLLFIFCVQLQSLPNMILDSQEKIVRMLSESSLRYQDTK